MAAPLPPSKSVTHTNPFFSDLEQKKLPTSDKELLEQRMSSASEIAFHQTAPSAEKSVLERVWQHIKTFFSSAGTNVSDFFWRVVGDRPSPAYVAKPVGIINIGNACYRIASNQALRVCEPLMDFIRRPLVKEEVVQSDWSNHANFERRQAEVEVEFISRQAVQEALIGLLDCLKAGKSPEEIKFAEENLWITIFYSGLHTEFTPPDAFSQLDAAAYLQLILANVLNYQHVEQPIHSAEQEGKTYSSKLPATPVSLISVPLSKNVNNLQHLVDMVYSETQEGDSENTWCYNDCITFESYKKHVQITSEPKDVLVLQLKRGVRNTLAGAHAIGAGASIDKREIQIPEGGLLDFSKAHGFPEGTLKYEVKSFIRLHAVLGTGGHYTSYVNKDGQWYHCDDNKVKKVSDEKAQEEMSLAYIFFFEKLPSEIL